MKGSDPEGMTEALFSSAERCASYTNTHADSFEIFAAGRRSTTVEVQGGLVTSRDGTYRGLGIRLAVENVLGSASTTDLTPGGIKRMVNEAVRMARATRYRDERFSGFATHSRRRSRDGIISDRIVSMGEGDLVELAREIYQDSMGAAEDIVSADVMVNREFGAYVVITSGGVVASSGSAHLTMACDSTAFDGRKRKTGFDIRSTRRKISPGGMGRQASLRAVAALRSEPLGKSEVMTCVMDPHAASQFLSVAFSSSIDGRSVVEERSPFTDRLGDEVAARAFTLHDNGQLMSGIRTAAVDAEGVPMRKTTIIQKGVLRSFLFDTYYGEISGTRSTGNALRPGHEPCAVQPMISHTTLTVDRGSKSREGMIADVDRGVYIEGEVIGMGHSNRISGDFSAVALTPSLISKGDIDRPLEPVTIAGNMYRSLARITGIGSDRRLVRTVFTPTIAFDGITVSG